MKIIRVGLNAKPVKSLRFLLLAMICFTLGLTSVSPLSSYISSLFNQNNLVMVNDKYLEGIEKSNRKNLLLLTEIDSLLSVLESSQVGMSLIVDASLKIGKAVTPLSKVVTKAFDLTFISITVTVALRWLLNLAEIVAPVLFFITMIISGIYGIARAFGDHVTTTAKSALKCLKIFGLGFVCTHLLIPYSIHSVSLLEGILYADIEKQKNTNLHNLHSDLIRHHAKQSIKEKIKHDIKQIENTLLKLPLKVDVLVSYYSKHMMITLLRSSVFPLAIFYFLMVILLSLFKLQINAQKKVTTSPSQTMILHQ